MFDDLDVDTAVENTEDDLLDLDLGDVEYFTKTEAIADLISAQDPDLTYVSRDGVKWEARYNSEDPKKSEWTNHGDLQYLNEFSILESLEKMLKTDKSLIAKIASNLL